MIVIATSLELVAMNCYIIGALSDISAMSCDCHVIHVAHRCALGWWGNPNVIGGRCQKCECSGNIDIHDPTACDPTTGECLKCLNDATGQYCEQCRQWYWGDAVTTKTCQRESRLIFLDSYYFLFILSSIFFYCIRPIIIIIRFF